MKIYINIQTYIHIYIASIASTFSLYENPGKSFRYYSCINIYYIFCSKL